ARTRSILSLAVSMSLMVLTLASCGGGSSRARAVTLKGSDTMVILGQKWAEVYMATTPGAVIQVTGGGSGTGIAALINGTTEIAQSSRSMKDTEKKQIEDKSGRKVEEHSVALDGVTIYVHQSNALTGLTVSQIKGIYTGVITNWKDVGGPDKVIVVYGRESSSGTYVFFKEHVLDGADFAPQVQTLPGTAAVADAIGNDPAGIGYGGYAYGVGIKHLAVSQEDGGVAIEPGEATVRDGSYPLARPLYWYTLSNPGEAASAFLAWVQSDAGQKVVKDVGYFPVR
ncbi:MAG: phosphate ABC transporter substrate-binding protein, partial [Candidatus Eisenbacteria bacterium]|nr:phosphate ABC transporter substrate-binding protein [Candidatus Eisenbacteria bacterium]